MCQHLYHSLSLLPYSFENEASSAFAERIDTFDALNVHILKFIEKIIPPKLVYSYFKYDIILRIHTRIYLNQLLKKFESCASHFLNFPNGKLYSPKVKTIFQIDFLIVSLKISILLNFVMF